MAYSTPGRLLIFAFITTIIFFSYVLGYPVLCSIAIADTAEPNPNVAHSSTAVDWLQKMTQTLQTQNYEGIFIYWQPPYANKIQTIRIIHGVDPQGERQRMIALNGAEQEVLRDKNTTLCIMPEASSLLAHWQAGKFFPALPVDLAVLLSYYEIELATEPERIVDEQTRLLSLRPKDHYRYGYRFWLTQAHYFPLKIELFNEGGIALEQTLFTQFEQKAQIEPEAWAAALNNRQPMPYERLSAIPATVNTLKSQWRTHDLPLGYRLHSQRYYALSYNPLQKGEQWVFTDGLASVSVYLEPIRASGLLGSSQRGVVHAYGLHRPPYQITAVGAVPEATVKAIAQSFY